MKLLLAYDGFERSIGGLEETARIAREESAEVTVVSVVPPDARASKSGGHVGMAPHAHVDVARAHAYLREQGIESEMRIEHGDPAEEVLKAAREGAFDLIVTGTRDRGPVARFLLGSVSHEIAEKAPCTVLIVTAEHTMRIEPRVVVQTRVRP
jgi:nucleotide-binding universal stress UspA family protein